MSDHPADRRRFKRIAFDARTELRQGEHTWPVKLIDLSLKGLLIERLPRGWVIRSRTFPSAFTCPMTPTLPWMSN
jgi:hypothetical protein